ncbi:hypothetical protein BGZ83_004208 [Gryganskiella cystojenkinii]|nr:hypothetical protein BGZ83_004208 [Gryganskiella cystojenkinii]
MQNEAHFGEAELDAVPRKSTAGSRIMNNYLKDLEYAKEQLEARQRAERMAALPNKEPGLSYWENWCQAEGYDCTEPTWESVGRYIREFIIPVEEEMNFEAQRNPAMSSLLGIRVFLQPVLLLRGQLQGMEDQDVLEAIAATAAATTAARSITTMPSSSSSCAQSFFPIASTPRLITSNSTEDTRSPVSSTAQTNNYAASSTSPNGTPQASLLSTSALLVPASSSAARGLLSSTSQLPPAQTRTASQLSPQVSTQVSRPSSHPAGINANVIAHSSTSTTGFVSISNNNTVSMNDNLDLGRHGNVYSSGSSRNGSSSNNNVLSTANHPLHHGHQDNTSYNTDSSINGWNSSSNRTGQDDTCSDLKAHEFELMGIGGIRHGPVPPATFRYRFDDDTRTVIDVLREWRFGLKGQPAIQELNRKYHGRWKSGKDVTKYASRACIVKAYKELVIEGGHSDKMAIGILQGYMGNVSLITFLNKMSKLKASSEWAANFVGRQGFERAITKSRPKFSSPIDPNRRILRESGRLRYAQVEVDEDDELEEEEDEIDDEPPLKRRRVGDHTTYDTPSTHQEQDMGYDHQIPPYPKPVVDKDVPFPFPVRDLQSIQEVWTEWTEGLEGGPSIESLLQIHGGLWMVEPYRSEYYQSFYSKDRIVNAIHEAVTKGQMATVEEAIGLLEEHRNKRKLQSYCASETFRVIMIEWGVKRKKKGAVGRFNRDYCDGMGWDRIPTCEKILQFTDEVVVPIEEQVNCIAAYDTTVAPICGTKVFIRPVLQLRDRMREIEKKLQADTQRQKQKQQQQQQQQQQHNQHRQNQHQHLYRHQQPQSQSLHRRPQHQLAITAAASDPIESAGPSSAASSSSSSMSPFVTLPSGSSSVSRKSPTAATAPGPNPLDTTDVATFLQTLAPLTALTKNTGPETVAVSTATPVQQPSSIVTPLDDDHLSSSSSASVPINSVHLISALSSSSELTTSSSSPSTDVTLSCAIQSDQQASTPQDHGRTEIHWDLGFEHDYNPDSNEEADDHNDDMASTETYNDNFIRNEIQKPATSAVDSDSIGRTDNTHNASDSHDGVGSDDGYYTPDESQFQDIGDSHASQNENHNNIDRRILGAASTDNSNRTTSAKTTTTTSNNDSNNNNNEVSSTPVQRDLSRFKAVEFILNKRIPPGGWNHRRQEILKTMAEIPIHKLHQDSKTVIEVLDEWRFGIHSGPALQDLNSQYGPFWRARSDICRWLPRLRIVKEFLRLVTELELSEVQSIEQLERLQGGKSLWKLYERIRIEHPEGNRVMKRYIDNLETYKYGADIDQTQTSTSRKSKATLHQGDLTDGDQDVFYDATADGHGGIDEHSPVQEYGDIPEEGGRFKRSLRDAYDIPSDEDMAEDANLEEEEDDDSGSDYGSRRLSRRRKRKNKRQKKGKMMSMTDIGAYGSDRRNSDKFVRQPQSRPIPVDVNPDKSRLYNNNNNNIDNNSSYSHSTVNRSNRKVHPGAQFPFPVRELHAIPDIWQEWTQGWPYSDGIQGPSMEYLAGVHGELWHRAEFKAAHYAQFYAKKRIVTVIRDAVAQGAVKSVEEAIEVLESLRGVKFPAGFCSSQKFRDLLDRWGIRNMSKQRTRLQHKTQHQQQPQQQLQQQLQQQEHQGQEPGAGPGEGRKEGVEGGNRGGRNQDQELVSATSVVKEDEM